MAQYRITGKMPKMLLEAPALPVGLEDLWGWFVQLHDSRGSSGFGPARISHLDLFAWQQVSGVSLAPWEVEAIRRADNAYLADHASRNRESRH